MNDRLRLTASQVLFLAALVGVVCCVYALYRYLEYSHVRDEVGTEATSVLKTTAETSYTTLSNDTFDFADLRGTPRVITLWATWSPLSRDDISLVSELVPTYGNEVSFVLLNRSEEIARAEAYLQQFTIPPEVHIVIDEHDSLYSQIEGFAMPETIVYDQYGNVATRVRGPLVEERIKTVLDSLIQTSLE